MPCIEKLEILESTPNTTTHDFIEWEPGFLCDYIVNTHHKYVLKSLPIWFSIRRRLPQFMATTILSFMRLPTFFRD